MIKKLVSHLGEYKRAAVLTPLFAALEAVMDVLLPTIMAFIIDLGIEKGDMHAIIKYGLLTFLVAAVALLLGVLAGKYAAEASTGFAGNLRDAMYENIQHYSFSNIDKFSTAGLVTRMTTDVTNVQNAPPPRRQPRGANVRGRTDIYLYDCLLVVPWRDDRRPAVADLRGGCGVPGHRAGQYHDPHLPHLRPGVQELR